MDISHKRTATYKAVLGGFEVTLGLGKNSNAKPWVYMVQCEDTAEAHCERWLNTPKAPTKRDYYHYEQWLHIWQEYAERLVEPTYLVCTETFTDGSQLVEVFPCAKAEVFFKWEGETFTALKNTKKYPSWLTDEPVNAAQLKKAVAEYNKTLPHQPISVKWETFIGY